VITALRSECDEVVCLWQPEFFHSVGSYYTNFEQTPDDEVVRLLAAARPI
jgi:putative phosphoribosyl transferase